MFDRRYLMSFDWILLGVVLLIAVGGIVMIYSASTVPEEPGGPPVRTGGRYWVAQLGWLGIALAVMVFFVAVDYRVLADYSVVLFLLGLLILLFLNIYGHAISGARSWVSLGGFRFQPSEPIKLITLLLLAKFLADRRGRRLTIIEVLVSTAIVLGPAVLIALQPDLGTAVVFAPLAVTLLFLAGIRLRWMGIALVIAVLVLPLAWTGLADYQKDRIRTFVNPGGDPLGSGYQIQQSKIAVGSGRLMGKGFLSGSQSQLNFIPEKHTDFIFSVLAEETGFAGSFVALGLYLLVILLCLDGMRFAPDLLGQYVVAGFVAVFSCHVIINVGMVIGLVPATGIPLPLMSYGGSSLVTNLAGLGLVLNVKMRRFSY